VRDLGFDPTRVSRGAPGWPAVADLAASFQAASSRSAKKAARAAAAFGARRLALAAAWPPTEPCCAASRRSPVAGAVSTPALCTDNAAMIASAGYFRFQAGQRDTLALDVEPSMPSADANC